MKAWLSENEDKPGATGKPRKSNLTDNESATMKTSKGVMQGYDGVAMVDARRQVAVHAQAYGEAQEHALLVPTLEGTRREFKALGDKGAVLRKAAISADSGFHAEANAKYLFEPCPGTSSTTRTPRPASARRGSSCTRTAAAVRPAGARR